MNMKKRTYITVLVCLGLLTKVAIAATTNPAVQGNLPLLPQTDVAKNAVVHATEQYIAPDRELVKDFCPPVEALVRNPEKQSWAAPGGWKTTSPSFLRTIDSFVGAQWVGVSIGEVICVYAKSSRSSFPVTLQRGKLVPTPLVGGVWSEDKGGYMECKSNEVKNCPFFTQVPKKMENVYEQLDFYKGKPVESSD
jgi:hypothetical protein